VKSPAFQFYVTDYLGSQRVQLLTLEQEGAYIRLLAFCWQHGSIPSNHKEIATLVGKGCSTTLARVVARMFEPCPDDPSKLIHDRLEDERKKQEAWKVKCSEGGKKSAELRKSAPRVVEEYLQDPCRIPSPTPSPVSKEREEGAPALSEIPSWEEFWEFCKSPHCGIAAEWFAKDKFLAVDDWTKKRDWKKYALRVRGWWDNDGRPMTPPQKNGTATGPKKSYLQMPG
jgi:uncharacterized protein YdaU (DUF1376 family)